MTFAGESWFTGPGTTTPTAPVAGAFAWYDASQIPVVPNNTPISSWPDSSGNGHTATQGTPALEPLYLTNVINGHPSVEFRTGADAYLATAAFGSPIAQPGMLFLVAAVTGLTGGNFAYVVDGIVAGNNWACGEAIAGASFAGEFSVYAGNLGGGNPAYPVANPSPVLMWTMTFNGATSLLRLGGMPVESNANVGTDTLTGITLGNGTGPAGLGECSIAEAIYYSSILTTAQIEANEAYLRAKYFP